MPNLGHCVLMLPHDSEDSGKITSEDLKNGPYEREIKYKSTPLEDLKRIRDRFRCYQEVLYTSSNNPVRKISNTINWENIHLKNESLNLCKIDSSKNFPNLSGFCVILALSNSSEYFLLFIAIFRFEHVPVISAKQFI